MKYPASYEVDEDGEATGTVHFFCSDGCRSSHVLLAPFGYVDGSATDWIEGTVCEEWTMLFSTLNPPSRKPSKRRKTAREREETQLEKHTPGPWHLGQAKSGRQYIYSRNQEQPLKPEVKLNKVFTQQQQANAQLMAAAPTLLAALQAAWHELDTHYWRGDYANRPLPSLMRNAIDKALNQTHPVAK